MACPWTIKINTSLKRRRGNGPKSEKQYKFLQEFSLIIANNKKNKYILISLYANFLKNAAYRPEKRRMELRARLLHEHILRKNMLIGGKKRDVTSPVCCCSFTVQSQASYKAVLPAGQVKSKQLYTQIEYIQGGLYFCPSSLGFVCKMLWAAATLHYSQ